MHYVHAAPQLGKRKGFCVTVASNGQITPSVGSAEALSTGTTSPRLLQRTDGRTDGHIVTRGAIRWWRAADCERPTTTLETGAHRARYVGAWLRRQRRTVTGKPVLHPFRCALHTCPICERQIRPTNRPDTSADKTFCRQHVTDTQKKRVGRRPCVGDLSAIKIFVDRHVGRFVCQILSPTNRQVWTAP